MASEYKEYPLQKLTTDSVYFDDAAFFLDEVIVEKPNEKYENVVIEETERFTFQWLWKIYAEKTSSYHVYLSEDVYDKLQDHSNVLYERE